jgi:hypothetical protein
VAACDILAFLSSWQKGWTNSELYLAISHNFASLQKMNENIPLNMLAREALDSESLSKRLQVSEELELEERTLAIAERKAALKRGDIDLAERELALQLECERRRQENKPMAAENELTYPHHMNVVELVLLLLILLGVGCLVVVSIFLSESVVDAVPLIQPRCKAHSMVVQAARDYFGGGEDE